MKKNVIIFFVITPLIVLSYYFYVLLTFDMFEVSLYKVCEIELPNKNYTIGLFHKPSNAVDQSCIQIRKLGTEVVLQNYERYNFVNSCKLSNDTLKLVLSDTIFVERKSDTIYFKLP